VVLRGHTRPERDPSRGGRNAGKRGDSRRRVSDLPTW
jgi:hypothetical protein